METWDMDCNEWQEEYFQIYHNKIKINIPSVEHSKARDEINSQLHALSILKAVGGENPRTDSPIPEHLAHLQSFYNPLRMDNEIYPEFFCQAKKILHMKVTEEFKGMGDRVVLFCCLEPVKTLKLRVSSILWLARGFIEYNKDSTQNKNIGELMSTEFQERAMHNTILKIVIWNCKNTVVNSFRENFLELVTIHSPSFVILTETRMHRANAIRNLNSLGFDCWAKVDSVGLIGGIWMLWRTRKVLLKEIVCTDQEMHAKINIMNEASTT